MQSDLLEQREQAPEPQEALRRRKVRRARALIVLALLVTFTTLVVGLAVFIEPASGATGGCGG